MRVCPSCQSRFVGGETFCPHDGTKLVDARELSPGELTGSKLHDIVRLDKLAYSDQFAERYTGRLLESRRAVYVTVFNQTFQVSPAATKRVETARAKVGSPMPPQINTLLQTHFDKGVPFLVESEPRGPSVRTLLDEKRSLAWDEAVRITANLARAMQWLHEQGVAHCSFHPTSIFVTSLQDGQIVVGDWALEALFPPDSAERLVEEDATAFAGYVDYMAPEIARATDKADIRSAVYALGCVLYEMVLGRVPLPGKSAAEVLKRHRHEKPVRLSIAMDGPELPGQLDDIVEMMLAKDPDKRFQSPAAAVAALSNLVGEPPETLAPALQRASETDVDDLYRTIDMDSVDRIELERAEEEASKPTLMMGSGQPAVSPEVKLATGGAVSGISTTDDAGETSQDLALDDQTRSTGQYNKPAAVHNDETDESFQPEPITRPSRNRVEDADSAKKTLVMGAMNALTADEAVDETDDDSKKTLLNFGNTSGPPKKLSRKQKKQLGKTIPPNGKTDPDIVSGDASPTDKTIRVNVDAQAIERQLQGPPSHAAPPPNTSEAPTERHDPARPDPNDAPGERARPAFMPTGGKTPADDAEAPLGGEASEPAPKPSIALDPEVAARVGLADGKPNIGVITPDKTRDATRDIDRSSWFSGDADDLWETSLAREAQEHSEQSNKKIVIGIVAALVLGTLGLIAYFEFLANGPEDEVEEAVATKPSEPAAPVVDLAEIRTAFDDALEGKRLIEPIGNSALSHLESLKRHGAEDPRYEEARLTFVSTARDAAKEADESGDLRAARALAGYASQFAPDDEELAAMTADFQARFTGVAIAPDAGIAEADLGTPDAGAEFAEEGVDEEEEEAKPDPSKVSTRPKRKPPRKKAPKKWDSGDAASLARDARSAHTSGNLDQARKLYEQALDVDPKSTGALSGLGKVFFDKADYRSAVKYQTKAVRYAPGRNDYRISLGQSYYRLGKYSEAIAVWEKVLAREPNNSTARQYVELAKRKLGR